MKKIFCVVGFIFFITTIPAYADYIIYCKDGKELFVKNYQITEVDVTYLTNYGIYHLPLDKVNIEKTEYERDMKDHGPKWQELQRKAEENQKRVQKEAEELIKEELEKPVVLATPYNPEQDLKESLKVVISLLEEWKIGNDGFKYWSNKHKPSSLISVKDYDYLTSGIGNPLMFSLGHGGYEDGRKWGLREKESKNFHRFRIKSTNRGGIPIEATWNIYVEKIGSEWKIYCVNEQ